MHRRQYVEERLSALFHRYAAVTPQAWLAYGEMCGLAHDVYGLDVALPHVAPQPQDEGARSAQAFLICSFDWLAMRTTFDDALRSTSHGCSTLCSKSSTRCGLAHSPGMRRNAPIL
jgi:hypothetical protein